MKHYTLSMALVFLLSLRVATDCVAYHDEQVHPAINLRAVLSPTLQLDSFLKEYL